MTTNTEPAALEVRDCRKLLGGNAGGGVHFHLPEFTVSRGERLALTGPSGCGKSTLLNLVSGLTRPDSGTIRIDGTAIEGLSSGRLDAIRGGKIGTIYQSFNLLPPFTAEENILMAMKFGRTGPRRTDARDLLKRVGLGHRIDARPDRMSVGERQRVAIARAIANEPRLILADEPTGALDPKTAEDVFQLLLEVSDEHGCTMLMVTHDHDLATRLPRVFDCSTLIENRTGDGNRV